MEILERHYGGQLAFEEAKSSKDYKGLDELFLAIKVNSVDDYGKVCVESLLYTRKGKPHCCSSPLKSLSKGMYCEVCASYYKQND